MAVPEERSVEQETRRERRSFPRHTVDAHTKMLLVNTGISMPGRVLDLSLGGCKIRTEGQFNVGIFVRVEAEFCVQGIAFRIAGVTQAIFDKNTLGVRFLDMSQRRREQLEELIAEIAEAAALDSVAEAIEGTAAAPGTP